MKSTLFISMVLAFIIAAPGLRGEEKAGKNGDEVAVIKTSEGEMVVQFWKDAAPATIEAFKKLARAGFYNGTTFHRIVKGYMIQGGDPYTKDPAKETSYGEGGPGYKLKAEFNDHSHQRGVISMARDAEPDTAGSQFFICLAAATRLDHKYTTFGKLIKGESVLEKIGETPVLPNPGMNGEKSKPTRRIVVESIAIAPADSSNEQHPCRARADALWRGHSRQLRARVSFCPRGG